MKKHYKIISIILTITLILSSVPLTAFAIEDSAYESSEITSENKENEESVAKILYEVENLRTEDKKVFRMSDGTFLSATYNQPVHFLKDSQWADIDNTVINGTDENDEAVLENTENSFKIKFANKAKDKKLVSLKKGNNKISWALIGSKKVTAKAENNDSQPQKVTTLNKLNGAVIYENILSDTDLKYTVTPTKVKEDIILKSLDAPEYFTFEYDIKDLMYKQTENGDIEIYNSNLLNPVFVISAPFMYDSAGEYSDAVQMQIEETDKGFTLTLAPDKDWLSSEEREFPVVIDPTIDSREYALTEVIDATVSFATRANTADASSLLTVQAQFLCVGRKNTNELGATIYSPIEQVLPEGSAIVDARLYLWNYNSFSININAYEITSDWGQTSSAGDGVLFVGENPGTPSYSSAVLDYNHYFREKDPDTGDYIEGYSFNITKAVQKWYSGLSQNRGIMLRATGLGTADNYAEFYDSDYATGSATPFVLVNYRIASGLEDYWSYTTLPAGRGGTAYVNNYNGNVTVIQPDCGTDGNRLPVAISHVYNSSNDYNEHYGGKWRINYLMEIEREDDSYYLIDSDGTKHYFYNHKDEITGEETLKDEDGLGYTLTIDTEGDNEYYIITDKNGGKMFFNYSGFLTRITDTNSNSATITLASHKILTITDGAGRVYSFTYNTDGTLQKITDPAGRQITYSYESNELDESDTKYLSTITFPDNANHAVAFQYDYEDEITVIHDIDGMETQFSYKTATYKRIETFKRISQDNQVMESYTYNYSHNATDITDKKDRKYTYHFNNFGQNTGIISHVDGSLQSYSWGQTEITENENLSGSANRIIGSSVTQQSINNPVKNHALESSAANFSTSKHLNSAATLSYDSSKGNIGSGSLKLSISTAPTSSDAYAFYAQVIYTSVPKSGYYTFSAYVNTGGATLAGNGAVVRLERWRSGYGAPSNTSVHYTKSGEWQRVSTTLYFNAGDELRCVVGNYGAGCTGTMWFDDFQLEYGETANPYNLVENATFSNALNYWDYDTGTVSKVTLTASETPHGITSGATITGNYNGLKRAMQTIKVKNGKAGDVYSIGGWAKANSLVLNSYEERPVTACTFGVMLAFFRDDYVLSLEQASFNYSYNGWQFSSAMAVAPEDYDHIRIILQYDYNANTAIFTLPFCYKENYGQTYSYDDDGNLISSVDLANTQQSFDYEDNQLSKIFNPSGSNYQYTYNETTKQPIYAVSSDGVMEQLAYDTYGNPTNAVTWSMQPTTQIESGKSYYIINAETRNALAASGDSAGSSVVNASFKKDDPLQMWTFTDYDGIATLDITVSGNTTLRLSVENNSQANDALMVVTTPSDSLNQKVGLQYNSDNTISLYTGVTYFGKCVDAQAGDLKDYSAGVQVKQYDYDNTLMPDMLKSQKWYFYRADINESTTPFIKSSATYTENGNYIHTSTDARGNTTTYNYDEVTGELDSVTNAAGYTTSYGYNINGDLTSVTSGGMTNEYIYREDRLVNIKVNNATTYTLNYDYSGRRTDTKVGSYTLSTLEYNADNLLYKQIYGNGEYITYAYDDLDRVVEKKYNDNDAKKLNYYYNSQGNISAIVDYMSGTTTRYIYDFCGRIVEIRENNATNIASHAYNKSTKYTYADKTNYISKVEYLENGQTHTVEYEYGSTDTATMPDAVYSVKLDGTQQLAYTYDSLGRLSTRKIVPANLQRTYTYLQGGYGANSTTTLVDSVTENGITTSYMYDELGNIIAIYENNVGQVAYSYDSLNQLSNVNYADGTNYNYTYQNGNIFTETVNGVVTKTYTYGNTSWKDLLTAYNGEAITYDAIGNPLSYRGKYTFTWSEGRNLTGVVANGGAYSHTYYYDASGRRVKKDYGSYSTVFTYLDDRLYSQTTGQEVIIFLYDEQGRMYGLDYNGMRYYYRINALGDVTGIYNSSGQLVTEYTYDAWGSLINLTGSEAFEVGSANPILYRGYYCDYDTNLYYLQSRYYDPETGRFINADGYVSTGQGVLANNMFAYCGNNPVNYKDPTGNIGIGIFGLGLLAVGIIAFLSGCDSQPSAPSSSVASSTTSTASMSSSSSSSSSKGGYNDYLDVLRQRESSNNYAAVNQYGYLGAYQMGGSALQDAGFKDSSGSWTELANSYGVYSNDDFLNTPKAQDIAITAYNKRVSGYIKYFALDSYIGTSYCGVTITQSGLLASCHLVGVGSMKKALSTGVVVWDGNGVHASEYLDLFSGYDVSEVW